MRILGVLKSSDMKCLPPLLVSMDFRGLSAATILVCPSLQPAQVGRPAQPGTPGGQATKGLAGKPANPRRAVLHFSATVRIKEKWSVFGRGRGPVTARKLRAEGSEQRSGQQCEHKPSHRSRQVRERLRHPARQTSALDNAFALSRATRLRGRSQCSNSDHGSCAKCESDLVFLHDRLWIIASGLALVSWRDLPYTISPKTPLGNRASGKAGLSSRKLLDNLIY